MFFIESMNHKRKQTSFLGTIFHIILFYANNKGIINILGKIWYTWSKVESVEQSA